MLSSFKRTLLVGLAAMSVGAATDAHAQMFNFTSNLSSGSQPGTLTGYLVLSGYTAGATGSFAASTVMITGYPAGVPVIEGNDATMWTQQFANQFTTVAGVITGWRFFAQTAGLYAPGNSSILCLNTGSGVDSGADSYCPTGLNEVGTLREFAYNFDGAQGVTFTAVTTTVPEPSTYALMAAGLATMVVIRRRRRA